MMYTFKDFSVAFKFALIIISAYFLISKTDVHENEQYKHVFGVFSCSTFTINIETSLIHSMKYFFCFTSKYVLIPRSKGNIFQISGICFKITILMTNQSFFTFKHNNF